MQRVVIRGMPRVLPGLLLSACVLQRSAPAASPVSFAGTYEVVVCRGACDQPDDALARGHLVLEDVAYPLDEVPEPARSYLMDEEFILVVIDSERAPNACFVLKRTREPITYAGSSPVGMAKWERDTLETVSLPLFHSPDAGYVATLSIRGGEIRGRGRSWGGEHSGDGTIPPDSIVGRRIGPPDRALCIRAAEAEAARPR